MKAENKSYARTLNNRLKGWDKSGVSSDLVEETRENLEMFYNKYGIETDDNFFSTNLALSDKAEGEYERIMDAFGNKAGSSINEMRRQYEIDKEAYQVKFNVNTFEEYINFTDKMKQSQSDKVIKNIMSSSQIAELYTIASQANYSGDIVDQLLIFEYESQQEFYDKSVDKTRHNANDPLYNSMLRILEDLTSEEDKDAWD